MSECRILTRNFVSFREPYVFSSNPQMKRSLPFVSCFNEKHWRWRYLVSRGPSRTLNDPVGPIRTTTNWSQLYSLPLLSIGVRWSPLDCSWGSMYVHGPLIILTTNTLCTVSKLLRNLANCCVISGIKDVVLGVGSCDIFIKQIKNYQKFIVLPI